VRTGKHLLEEKGKTAIGAILVNVNPAYRANELTGVVLSRERADGIGPAAGSRRTRAAARTRTG
jgi:hypothetical protein